MEIKYYYGFNVEWLDSIIELHNKTDMGRSPSMKSKFLHAYSNSFAVVTAWNGEILVGFGRMISDGEMYSSIFDVVIDPSFQKRGIGKRIVQMLIEKAPDTCIHLTSTFGNEEFYQKVGFKKHKTAFAKYPWESEYLY